MLRTCVICQREENVLEEAIDPRQPSSSFPVRVVEVQLVLPRLEGREASQAEQQARNGSIWKSGARHALLGAVLGHLVLFDAVFEDFAGQVLVPMRRRILGREERNQVWGAFQSIDEAVLQVRSGQRAET
jgi:hypothetical protein